MQPIDYIHKLAAIVTVLTTAIAFGTDFFFALVGKTALSRSEETALLNVAGNLHEVADKRMPIVGMTAILGTLYHVFSKGPGTTSGILFLLALSSLLVHLLLYLTVAKPVNAEMRKAVKEGKILANTRALQNKWDSVIGLRSLALLAAMVFILLGLGLA